MLIACVSDIHGNLPALQAAVADAKTRGATEVICAGDIIGYGPFPNEVCDFLVENRIESISGNYDCKVLDVLRKGESVVAELSTKKKELLFWTVDHIAKSAKQFLKSLPDNLEKTLTAGQTLIVVHGSPASNEDAIYPSITTNGLEMKLGEIRPDVLVCGHTHIPFVRRIGNILVANCGSVGHPVDGDPMPSYAIISVDKETVSGRIIRFEYDTEKTVAALKKTSLPKGLQKDFAEGIKRRFL
jgi:putative phosphoesterase